MTDGPLWTRRNWMMLAGAMAANAENGVLFQSPLPADINITTVAELDERRLIAVGGGHEGVKPVTPKPFLSGDLGRTWQPGPAWMERGKPFEGMVHSMLRLRDGRLGLVFSRKEWMRTPSYAAPVRTWLFSTSGDNGTTWGEGVPIDMPARYEDPENKESENKGVFIAYPFGRMIQLSSGRLVVPCYWYMGGRHLEHHPGLRMEEGPSYATVRGHRVKRIADGHLYEAAMGGCFVYFSDDGKVWQRSTGSIMVWPLPGEGGVGGFGATWEPVVIELRDKRVLMFMRTNVGRIFQSFSKDGGLHWTPSEPAGLASGDVPCCLGRLPRSGHLMVIWNQSSAAEIRAGYSRGRLSTAVSTDEGKSWGHFRTVAISDGLGNIARVETPPVQHVRANRELGVLPDGYSRHHYPKLAFSQGKVLLLYYTGQVQPGGRFERWKPMVKAVEESWLLV
ncbi:MAG: sialidase family protein [Bryobacteraceae bacterium]